ncbi:MAG TPA: 4Fe-4S dicluster domain-containing protein [Xanthomonadales bacterium]|nr:4Fe-4S dicluster domain-containing protein [Xanthomonadales bacterium]
MEGKPLPVALKVIGGDDDGAMYAAHKKIYPREIGGRFQRLRVAAVFWLLGMYYLFPWINWDGRQMVLFDLPARKFYILGLVFWPQDFFFLAALLIVAALSLFFFTAVAGRLWCGFACPQTVWTEVFLWMENWVEGDRNARMRLDKAPMSARKFRLKATKQFLWVTFSLWTGFTFVGFFTPIRQFGPSLMNFDVGGWELFWFLFYSLATYGNAGFLREQVCKYMCPYARFQSAMIDKDTLIITYDEARGEPRGARKRAVKGVAERRAVEGGGIGNGESGIGNRGAGSGESGSGNGESGSGARVPANPSLASVLPSALSGLVEEAARIAGSTDSRFPIPDSRSSNVGAQPATATLGDCIDCKACVLVCPTGIDIRDGLQYECIACAACIDACDEVMDKVGYPRGLVRYSTEHALEGKQTKLIRKRTIFYALLLTGIISALIYSVATRIPLIVDVIRDRGELYRQTSEGAIENSYQVKIMNKTEAPRHFVVSLIEPEGLRIVGQTEVEVPGGSIKNLALTLEAEPGAIKGMVPMKLRVVAADDPLIERIETNRFFAP